MKKLFLISLTACLFACHSAFPQGGVTPISGVQYKTSPARNVVYFDGQTNLKAAPKVKITNDSTISSPVITATTIVTPSGTITPGWKLTGNTLTENGIFGTTNGWDIIFKSLNVERGRLKSNGHWSFSSNFYDGSDIASASISSRVLSDATGLTSFDWDGRQLLSNNGTTVFEFSGNSTDSFIVTGLGSTYYKPGTIIKNKILQIDTFVNIGKVDTVASYINIDIKHNGYDFITFKNSRLGNYHAWQEEGGIGMFLTGYNSTSIDAPFYIGTGTSGYSKSISLNDNSRLIDFNDHNGVIKTGTGSLVFNGVSISSPVNTSLLLRGDIFNGTSDKGVDIQGYDGGAWQDLIYVKNGATPLIIMSNLPTSAIGLPSGALWNNAGVLSVAP